MLLQVLYGQFLPFGAIGANIDGDISNHAFWAKSVLGNVLLPPLARTENTFSLCWVSHSLLSYSWAEECSSLRFVPPNRFQFHSHKPFATLALVHSDCFQWGRMSPQTLQRLTFSVSTHNFQTSWNAQQELLQQQTSCCIWSQWGVFHCF